MCPEVGGQGQRPEPKTSLAGVYQSWPEPSLPEEQSLAPTDALGSDEAEGLGQRGAWAPPSCLSLFSLLPPPWAGQGFSHHRK